MFRPTFLFPYVALVGATVALTVLAAHNETLPGDVAILQWAQDRAFPGQHFSDIMRAMTTTQVVQVTGLGAAVALALLGRRREAVQLAIGIAVLPVLQWGLKELVDRPRPHEPVADLRAEHTSPSFPSGHVMPPAFLYAFLLYASIRSRLPLALSVPVALWSTFVLVFAGPPNVWLGVHWPSDVLGGWAWALVMLGPLVWPLERRSSRGTDQRSI